MGLAMIIRNRERRQKEAVYASIGFIFIIIFVCMLFFPFEVLAKSALSSQPVSSGEGEHSCQAGTWKEVAKDVHYFCGGDGKWHRYCGSYLYIEDLREPATFTRHLVHVTCNAPQIPMMKMDIGRVDLVSGQYVFADRETESCGNNEGNRFFLCGKKGGK
jgi:hypothetical protein